MANEEIISFRKALFELFRTPNGEIVLDFLQQSYVDNTCLGQTTEQTFYNLGQKELVQGLIRDAKTDISELQQTLNSGGLINE